MGKSLSSLRNGPKAHVAGAEGVRGHCCGGGCDGRWHKGWLDLAVSSEDHEAAGGTVRGADREIVLRHQRDL